MANITVTTNSNMDSPANLALLDGEDVTINDGITLTINSDILYSQQAARPRNTSTVNTGKYFIDGRDVWWIPFDASSGNIPTLSTFGTLDVTVSGSGVGEFLGIWGTYGVLAPNTAGTAIPTSGFVKLRRKTGTIADNDVLTFSNGATVTVNSATGGQRGWLWHSQGSIAEAYGYSGNFETIGDWFDLGTGTGLTTQTIQFFAPFRLPAIQVETASGSGVYEWWCNSINLTSNMDLANASNRTFSCSTAGVISFTNRAVPSGAKVRCPNILLGFDMINNSKSRGNFKNQGLFKLNKTISCHTIYPNVYPGISVDFRESCFSGGLLGSTGLFCAYKTIYIDDCAVAGIIQDAAVPFVFGNASEKVTINKLYACNGQTAPGISISVCKELSISNSFVHVGSTTSAINLAYVDNFTVTNCDFISTGNSTTPMVVNTCSNGRITNVGLEPSGAAGFALGGSNLEISSSRNLIFDNIRHPANFNRACNYAWAGFTGNDNVHIRNLGTVSSPYLNMCGRSMLQGNGNTNCTLSRIYTAEVGSGWYTIHGYQNKNINSNDYIPNNTNVPFFGNQSGSNKRKYGGSPVGTGILSSKELMMFSEYQASSTSIMLNLVTREKDSYTDLESDAYTILAGTPTFDSLNSILYMPSLNDEIVYTWNYKVKSLTGFANTTPVVGGVNTGNIQITYDLDRGTGFTGTYKTLTAANLSAETSLNKAGTGIRIKFKTTTANASNAIYRVHFYATTTATDIANYLYPLSNPQIITIQALTGTLAALFDTTTGELLAKRVATSSTVILHPDYYSTVSCALRHNKPGYESIDTVITLTENFQTIPIQQTDSVIANTNPGALGITVTNHGTSPVTWNGKVWSITVTVTDSSAPAAIAQYLSWQRAQDAYNLLSTLHNAALHDCIIPVGTGYETARGTVYGSTGAALKGVRVVDGSGNEIPGFARMQADDGTYYSPAASYTLTVSNIVNDSRILVRRTDTLAVIANQAVTTGSFTYTYTHTTDIPIEIVVRKATASPYYQEWRTTTTLSNSNNSQTANQLSDT